MAENKNYKLLWKLFTSTLYLSAFTFGGGYVIITLMRQKFVEEFKWLREKEMLNIAAIAQSAPGPIAVNAAIVVGFRLAGMIGVLVAVLGTIIPPFAIISLISFFYTAFRENVWISLMLEGMQAGVAAVVVAVALEMAWGVLRGKNTVLIATMFVAFIANAYLNINILYIILSGIVIGMSYHYYSKRKGEDK